MGHRAAGRAYVYPRGPKATCTRISSPRPKRRLPREIKRIARVHARYGTSPRALIPSLSTSTPRLDFLVPGIVIARQRAAVDTARALREPRARARWNVHPCVTRVSDAERGNAGARRADRLGREHANPYTRIGINIECRQVRSAATAATRRKRNKRAARIIATLRA